MGRTIPSFRISAQMERAAWKPFRKHLTQEDKEAFDEMLNLSTHYWSAASASCRSSIFEALMMTVIFSHYVQLERIREEISKIPHYKVLTGIAELKRQQVRE